MPGIPDEDQSVVAPVVFVAEHLEGGGGQVFGFVDDAELDAVAAGGGVGVLTDADAGVGGDAGEVFVDASDGGASVEGVDDGAVACACACGADGAFSVLVAWSPFFEEWFGFVPAGVAAGREGFADCGWA